MPQPCPGAGAAWDSHSVCLAFIREFIFNYFGVTPANVQEIRYNPIKGVRGEVLVIPSLVIGLRLAFSSISAPEKEVGVHCPAGKCHRGVTEEWGAVFCTHTEDSSRPDMETFFIFLTLLTSIHFTQTPRIGQEGCDFLDLIGNCCY